MTSLTGRATFTRAGREFVDQHRIFHWGYDSRLTPGRSLCFDLESASPRVEWSIRQAAQGMHR